MVLHGLKSNFVTLNQKQIITKIEILKTRKSMFLNPNDGASAFTFQTFGALHQAFSALINTRMTLCKGGPFDLVHAFFDLKGVIGSVIFRVIQGVKILDDLCVFFSLETVSTVRADGHPLSFS